MQSANFIATFITTFIATSFHPVTAVLVFSDALNHAIVLEDFCLPCQSTALPIIAVFAPIVNLREVWTQKSRAVFSVRPLVVLYFRAVRPFPLLDFRESNCLAGSVASQNCYI